MLTIFTYDMEIVHTRDNSERSSVIKNAMHSADIIDVIDSDKTFYINDKFYNRLSLDNRLNVNLPTDLISFGFY